MDWKNVEIKFLLNAAIEAGQEIKRVYHTDFSVETKKDESPLTLADKLSHQVITKKLEKTGYPVMSEEGVNIAYNERKKWNLYWLVDPLDGTKEFIKKNDEFTVNVALVKNQVPVLGIIYVPILDIIYWAREDKGSFKMENVSEKIKYVSDEQDIIDKSLKLPLTQKPAVFTIIASRSHMSDETQKYIENLRKQHPDLKLMSRGSSLKLCMIAEGKANVYPRFAPTSEWDTAAGHAIVKYAGGTVTQINEKDPLIYNKIDLLNPWFIVKR